MKYLFYLTAFLGLLFFTTACEQDKCKNVVCIHGECIDGSCWCDYGYTGKYCETCTTSGYSCVSGVCVYKECGAAYGTLTACQSACGSGGGTAGYICLSGSCNYVSSGGVFSSLSACQNFCNSGGGSAGYICQSGNCNYVSSGATYSSLAACLNGCSSGGGSAGYICQSGNCNYVSSGAAYSSLSACQNACSSSSQSSITFKNNSYTDMVVQFNGQTKTAFAEGGTVIFNGSPGQSASGKATTKGTTTSGATVGLTLEWNLSYAFPSIGNSTINLNVNADFFFLRVRNQSGSNGGPLFVNHGLQSQTEDNIIIAGNGSLFDVGYYRYWSNSNVRLMVHNNPNQYWHWSSLTASPSPNRLVTVQAN